MFFLDFDLLDNMVIYYDDLAGFRRAECNVGLILFGYNKGPFEGYLLVLLVFIFSISVLMNNF